MEEQKKKKNILFYSDRDIIVVYAKSIFVCYMKSICGYYSLAFVINAVVVVAIDVAF